LIRDLQSHRGRSIVVAGDQQPAMVHALVHAINHVLGNNGVTINYIEPVAANPIQQVESLRDLVRDMEANAVQVLIMLGGNPAYSAPADLDFAGHLVKSNFNVHLSLYDDETSALSIGIFRKRTIWSPGATVRAFDGTATVLQPLIAPLYGGRTAHEILAAVAGDPGSSSYELVHEYWRLQHRGNDFDVSWRRWLHDGVVAGTAFASKPVRVQALAALTPRLQLPRTGAKNSLADSEGSLEIVFRCDSTILDGHLPTTDGCKSCPSRSPSSLGTTRS
jgi:molybdopterin-containing oxidoreductase family iron-sulfur binding subunit